MALAPKRPKRVSAGIVTIILSLLSVVMMTVWILEEPTGPLHSVRAASLTLAAPLQQAGTFVGVPADEVRKTVDEITTSEEDIAELRARNEELLALTLRLEEYRIENERLARLLDVVDAYSLSGTTARVISRTTDSWNRTITINKGTSDGLSIGMPVMNADGLLGQVETVGLFSSTVRLLMDQRSGVAVFLQSSRTEGVVSGSSEGLLYLDLIPLAAPVKQGDAVITSGAGGVYPKGLIIGVVASVSHDSSDVYQTIVITPVKRVDTYEEVFVMTGRQSEVSWNPDALAESKKDGEENPDDAQSPDTNQNTQDVLSVQGGQPAQQAQNDDTQNSGGSQSSDTSANSSARSARGN
ncbi:MAG: rod shape-determining protein MreC [Coriobacteriia bacterium]|nr:rod shape-determining protein MreC [Coriobacteriia bacterium]